MWHRDKATYDTFPGQDNVIVNNGELPAVMTEYGIGWITPCNHIFHNREDAISYATKLDQTITYNRQRLVQQKVRF